MYSRIWIPNCASMARPLSRNLVERAFPYRVFSVTGMTTQAIEYNNRPAGGLPLMFITLPTPWVSTVRLCSYCRRRRVPSIRIWTSILSSYSRRANANYVYSEEDSAFISTASNSRSKIMPAAFELDYLMLTTPEMEQMIADFGQRQDND